MTDSAQPLGPLDPHVVAHLNSTLGPAQSFLLEIRGGLDVRADGWVIGRGETVNGNRGTAVEVRLTPGGSLVTTRLSWTTHADGSRSDTATGQAHPTPAAALDWLLADGKGKLGPASKVAWVAACAACPPMAGLDVQRIA